MVMTRAARARENMEGATGAPAEALVGVVRLAADAEMEEDTIAAVNPATDAGAAAVHTAADTHTVHTGADADGVDADADATAEAIDHMRIVETRAAEAGAAGAATDTATDAGAAARSAYSGFTSLAVFVFFAACFGRVL